MPADGHEAPRQVGIPLPPSVYTTTNVQLSKPKKGPRRPKREGIEVPRLPARAAVYPNAVISAGGYHTAIVDIDGYLHTFGEGKCGQLGHPPRDPSQPPDNETLPRWVASLEGVKVMAVSCGLAHTAAICSDQYLYTFGFARSWLGHGDWHREEHKCNITLPRRVEGLERVARVACGWSHTLVVLHSGELYSWGEGADGRLGHGNEKDMATPTRVNITLEDAYVSAIAAGGAHSAAVLRDGRLLTWGTGRPLGHGNLQKRTRPMHVRHLQTFYNAKMVEVSCGAAHTIGLGTDGTVYTWGWGQVGQLGHGDREERLFPTKIDSLQGMPILRICAGSYHSVLASEKGDVITFGAGGCSGDATQISEEGEEGRLGYGAVIPHEDDEDDGLGQKDQLNPKVVSGTWRLTAGSKPKNTAAGGYHTVISTEGGQVYSCGVGAKGRLGHGHEQPSYTPTVIDSLKGVTVAGVALSDKSKLTSTTQDSSAFDSVANMPERGLLTQ